MGSGMNEVNRWIIPIKKCSVRACRSCSKANTTRRCNNCRKCKKNKKKKKKNKRKKRKKKNRSVDYNEKSTGYNNNTDVQHLPNMEHGLDYVADTDVQPLPNRDNELNVQPIHSMATGLNEQHLLSMFDDQMCNQCLVGV